MCSWPASYLAQVHFKTTSIHLSHPGVSCFKIKYVYLRVPVGCVGACVPLCVCVCVYLCMRVCVYVCECVWERDLFTCRCCSHVRLRIFSHYSHDHFGFWYARYGQTTDMEGDWTRLCMCVSVCLCVCVCVCMCVCVYVCIYYVCGACQGVSK